MLPLTWVRSLLPIMIAIGLVLLGILGYLELVGALLEYVGYSFPA